MSIHSPQNQTLTYLLNIVLLHTPRTKQRISTLTLRPRSSLPHRKNIAKSVHLRQQLACKQLFPHRPALFCSSPHIPPRSSVTLITRRYRSVATPCGGGVSVRADFLEISVNFTRKRWRRTRRRCVRFRGCLPEGSVRKLGATVKFFLENGSVTRWVAIGAERVGERCDAHVFVGRGR